MSVFRVKLNQGNQGTLDSSTTSVQRTMYVQGPNRIYRKLNDGDTFTDSNYWKRFAYPQVALDDAFIEVTSDDGSVYSDVASENVFPVTWLPGAAEDGILVATDTYDDDGMSLDILATYGGPAVFCQISNSDSTHNCHVRLNGSTDAVITLSHGETQVFNSGDLAISKIEFDNSASGASNVDAVEVLLSVRSVSNS